MNQTTSLPLAIAALAFALCACGSGSPSGSGSGSPGGGEATGEVSLAVTVVPPGVQCIQITATGSTTVSQSFAATPGAGTSASLSLGELPLGSVAITGQAFNAACASIAGQQPSWVADKQVVNLQAGVITSLTITFRPDNQVTGTPTFVGNIVQVAAGYNQIGLVMSDGSVDAAGYIAGIFPSSPYGPVPGLSNVAQLAPAMADYWDCASLTSGTVECWGTTNTYGQLGNGTTTSSTTPVAVTALANVTQLCAGIDYACALSQGRVYCWGNNSNGQLGNGTTTNSSTPVQVSSLANVESIACGGNHACAITNNLFATVQCWGYNGYGQLGNNSTADAHTPALANNLNGIVQLAASQNGTCALRADGTLFCWGDNGEGAVGIGTFANALVPTKVALSGVQQVAAQFDTFCVRRSDATVWCWGTDQYGDVGDGSGAVAITSPVQVMGLPPSASIAAGGANACSVGTDLSLECWGNNSSGQIPPIGNFYSAFVPVPIKF
jgi:hypothetical protein